MAVSYTHLDVYKRQDLIIPYDAVYFSAGDAYVYCVEDGKLVKTPVTVGLMNDTQVSIADGLTADSQVVTCLLYTSSRQNGTPTRRCPR